MRAIVLAVVLALGVASASGQVVLKRADFSAAAASATDYNKEADTEETDGDLFNKRPEPDWAARVGAAIRKRQEDYVYAFPRNRRLWSAPSSSEDSYPSFWRPRTTGRGFGIAMFIKKNDKEHGGDDGADDDDDEGEVAKRFFNKLHFNKRFFNKRHFNKRFFNKRFFNKRHFNKRHFNKRHFN